MPASLPTRPAVFLLSSSRRWVAGLDGSLQDEGYRVCIFGNAKLAAEAFGRLSPEALLLDWMPESMAFIRRYGGLVPTLVLTEHNVLMDVVQALRAGAVDYIRMPCHAPEVLARIAQARQAAPRAPLVSVAGLNLDVAGGTAQIGGRDVSLSGREARILAALMRCPGQTVSRETLMRVAGVTTAKPTIIESYIKQLRRRHTLLRQCLQTRYGRGYAFCR